MNAALIDTDRQHYGLTLAVLVIAALAFALQQTMVAPALPAIQEDLGASSTTVTFVLTGFLLTASVSTPIFGRLGDMFGKERMLVICLSLFAVGSLVCALSHTIEVLIAGRAIQGSAAAVFPLSFGIIRDEFPAEKVGMGIGLISATFGIGGGVGLVLSGLIVDNVPYEWIFWFALPAILIAIVMTFLFIPESPIKSPAKIDWGGAALLSTTLVCLLVGVSEANTWGWGDPRIIGLFAASLIAAVAWVRYEREQPQPLVDISMMRERAVFTTNATALLVGFGMFGSFILIPLLVQLPPESGVGFGATVTEAGLFMAPSAAIMLFAGPLAGWLGSRVGSRTPLMIGTASDRGELRHPRGLPRNPRLDLRVQRDPRPGNRILVRVHGKSGRRGRAPVEDRRGHRHQHDHANDRRLARRSNRRDDSRRARSRVHWLPVRSGI